MFENNNIFILGMARSGYEAAKLLAKRGNKIMINDGKEQDSEHVKELEDLGVEVIIGSHPLKLITRDLDYIIKNPGIKDSHEMIVRAKELGIPVINEVEMSYRLLPKDITLIGITGSNGKTTTTTLVHEILKASNKPVVLAGNIGFPLSSFIGKVKAGDILLMEISIQQLCNFDEFKTDISVLTNIYEAHLDFVGNKENYINIKKRIFAHHTNSDHAILNYDNKDVIENTNDISSQKTYFSKNEMDCVCHIKDNSIYYEDEKIIDIDDILIKGQHNYENIMAAISVCKVLSVDNETIRNVLKNFSGVEHRIEFVRSVNGIKVYNDSKSTNVTATQTALSSFDNPTILLLGGMDRGHSFEGLTSYMKNVKRVVSYGETKDRIKDYCNNINIKCSVVSDLKSAVDVAFSEACEGDVILLSPGCASWDQYSDFEERGRVFKKYINEK